MGSYATVGKPALSSASTILTNDLIHTFLWNHGRIRKLNFSSNRKKTFLSYEKFPFDNNIRYSRFGYNNNIGLFRSLSSGSDGKNKQSKSQSKRNDNKSSFVSNERNVTNNYNNNSNNNGKINHTRRSNDDGNVTKIYNKSMSKVNEIKSTNYKNERNDNNSNKRPDKVALEQIVNDLTTIRDEINRLNGSVPPIWMIPDGYDVSSLPDCEQRRQIFAQVTNLFDNILLPLIRQNILMPNSKHRREVAVIVENLFRFYHHCIIDRSDNGKNNTELGSTVFDKCNELLQFLGQYQYEPSHYECYVAVTAAAREGRWMEGGAIYEDHIQSGYFPTVVKDDIQAAMVGLYVIARAAQINNSRPVECVMDGVLKLSMISSQDNESYVFAAGAALGYAGEWESLLKYLKTSSTATDMGQPLVASAMQACILNDRFKEAVALFDNLVQGQSVASEWQWGGGQDRIHPVCNDLAMRALGGIHPSDDVGYNSCDRAIALLEDVINSGFPVSCEAVTGVVQSCENAGRWEDAVDIWMTILDTERRHVLNPESCTSLLTSEGNDWMDLFNTSNESGHRKLMSSLNGYDRRISDLGFVLDTVMRSCNASKHFSLSLLLLRLFEVSLLETSKYSHPTYQRLADEIRTTMKDHTHSQFLQSLLPTIGTTANANELLTTTLVSLIGLDSVKMAASLNLASNRSDFDGTIHKDFNWPRERIPKYSEFDIDGLISNFEKDLRTYRQLNPWDGIDVDILNFTAALALLESRNENLSFGDIQTLSSILASIIRTNSAMGRPETGLYLAKWTKRRNIQQDRTVIDQNKFETLDMLSNVMQSNFNIKAGNGSGSPLILTDALMAAVLEAYGNCSRTDAVDLLLNQFLSQQRPYSEWFLTFNATIKFLFTQNRTDDAMTLFREILAVKRNPDIFCVAAQGLLNISDHRGVTDLYRSALVSGCLSEQLSLLAIKAVVSKRVNNRMTIFRNIVTETAKFLSLTKTEWVEKQYWSIKKLVGEKDAHYLMGWNDPTTSSLDELQLAIETLEKRAKENLVPLEEPLELILLHASSIKAFDIADELNGLPLVPRDNEAWVSLCRKVVNEMQHSRMIDDPRLIGMAAHAFHNIGCTEDAIALVNESLSRRVRFSNEFLLESEGDNRDRNFKE